MSKPTEGPYTVAHRPDFGAHYIIAADGKVLFRLEYADGDIADREQKAATARLLAKSWEMRQVICDMLIGIEYSQDRARAILREIDGDSQ